jgi:hypothetical protein
MVTQTGQSNSVGATQFDRIGISAADADASAIQMFPCPGSSVATLAAICDTASVSITLRLFYYNASSLPCGTSVATVFSTGKTADFGPLFTGVPDSDIWRPIAGATSIGIKIDAVSGGRWSLHGSVG